MGPLSYLHSGLPKISGVWIPPYCIGDVYQMRLLGRICCTSTFVLFQVLACSSPSDRGSLKQSRDACHSLAVFSLVQLRQVSASDDNNGSGGKEGNNFSVKTWLAPLLSLCSGEQALTR